MKTLKEFTTEGAMIQGPTWHGGDHLDFNDFLKKQPILKKYYNSGAQYDDAIFSEIPLKILEKFGISKSKLRKIDLNRPAYEGAFLIHKGKLTIIGAA